MLPRFGDASMSPKTTIIYFWRHQDILSNIRKHAQTFQKNIFWAISKCRKRKIRIVEKTRAENSWGSVLSLSGQSWIWDQYLPENMRWAFGNMGSIFAEKTLNEFGKFRNVESLKLWNFAFFENIWCLDIYNIWSRNSLINRWLMVHGSWLKAQGSCLMAEENLALGPRSWGTQRQISLGHEPWATSLEAWAISLEPWNINHE